MECLQDLQIVGNKGATSSRGSGGPLVFCCGLLGKPQHGATVLTASSGPHVELEGPE